MASFPRKIYFQFGAIWPRFRSIKSKTNLTSCSVLKLSKLSRISSLQIQEFSNSGKKRVSPELVWYAMLLCGNWYMQVWTITSINIVYSIDTSNIKTKHPVHAIYRFLSYLFQMAYCVKIDTDTWRCYVLKFCFISWCLNYLIYLNQHLYTLYNQYMRGISKNIVHVISRF